MYRVFSRPGYFLFALAVGIVIFLAVAWWETLPLLARIITDLDIPLDRALTLGTQLLYHSLFDFTTHGFSYAAATALLIGINAALLMFYFRMFRAAPSSATAASGLLGGGAALLGFGCAACGSVFLVSLIGTLGGAGLLTLLPYGGEELGYAGVALLAVSAFFLARAINKPPVCPI